MTKYLLAECEPIGRAWTTTPHGDQPTIIREIIETDDLATLIDAYHKHGPIVAGNRVHMFEQDGDDWREMYELAELADYDGPPDSYPEL